MADALLPGGVYLIDAAFGTDGTADTDLDEWVMQRDGVTVIATPSHVNVVDAPRRLEMTLDWHESLRPYTPDDFARFVHRNGGFTLAGCYKAAGTGDDGISRFEEDIDGDLPPRGRAIVVLSRVS